MQEALFDISRDTTFSHAYLDKLKSIYTSPVYQGLDRSSPAAREKAQEGDHRRLGRGVAQDESLQAIGELHYRGHHVPATTVVGRWTAEGPSGDQHRAFCP